MKRFYIFLVGFVVVASVIGGLVFFNTVEDTKNAITFNQERVFKEITSKNTSIPIYFYPIYLKAKKDSLTILNYDSQKVLFLDESKGVYDSLGAGRGESPLESKRIYHYDYDDTHLYTFDVSNRSITKATREGELINYYQDSLYLDHAHRLVDDTFLVSMRENNFMNLGFATVDISTEEITFLTKVTKSFDAIDNSWWIFDGKFYQDPSDGSIFYVTFFSDEMIKIDTQGDLVYKKDLIHETPLIKLTLQDDMLFPSADAYESTLDCSIDDAKLYVLSNISDRTVIENKDNRVLDVYATKNGAYSHSYILPNIGETAPTEIEVVGDLVYLLYEETIELYELEK